MRGLASTSLPIVANGTNGAETIGADHGTGVVCYWSPRESGMVLKVSVQLPAPQDLASEIVAITEDGKVPESHDTEVVGHIVVGGPAFLCQICGKGLVGHKARSLKRKVVNGLAIRVEDAHHESTPELVLQLSVHGIEVPVGSRPSRASPSVSCTALATNTGRHREPAYWSDSTRHPVGRNLTGLPEDSSPGQWLSPRLGWRDSSAVNCWLP